MSTIKTFGAVDERSLDAAEAVHGGRRRRVRRALRRPPPGLQPADRRRHRLRGLRVAVGRRLRHRLRQQGRADRPDARAISTSLGGVEPVMGEITRRISFGMGVPAPERTDHPVLDAIRNGRLRAAAQARAAGRVAARHGRLGQPLRQRDGGRGRPGLGRRPLRLARLRPQDRVGLPRARAGPAVRRPGGRGRDGLAAGAVRGRLRARRVLRRRDGAGGRVRLRRPRHRRRQGARDPRRRRRRTRCTTTTTSRGGRSTSAATTG